MAESRQHTWRRYVSADNGMTTYRTWCGRVATASSNKEHRMPTHHDPEGTTCMRCLKSLHDHFVSQAEEAGTGLRNVSDAFHAEDTRRMNARRRKKRRQARG